MGLRITPAAEAHPCIPEDEQKTQRLLQNAVTLCHLCLPCTCLVTRHPTLGASPAWGARGHHNVPGVPTAKLQVLLRDVFPDPGGHMKLGQHEGWRCLKLALHFSQLSLGALSRGPGVAPALASAGACTKSHYPLHLLSTGLLGGGDSNSPVLSCRQEDPCELILLLGCLWDTESATGVHPILATQQMKAKQVNPLPSLLLLPPLPLHNKPW